MPLLTHQEDSKPVTAPVVEEEEKPEVEQEKAAVGTGSASTGLPAWAIAWITALILILFAGYILWLMRIRVRFLLVGIRKGSKLSADQKVIVMTERWVSRLKRKGIRRSSNETLRESVIRWEKEMPALSNSLGQLLTLFEKARYSPSSVSEAEWRSVYTHSRELKAALKKAEDSAA